VSTQPLRGTSSRRPAPKADNLITICESIVLEMWEPRRLTNLWASTACCRVSVILFTIFSSSFSNISIVCYLLRATTKLTSQNKTTCKNIVSCIIIFNIWDRRPKLVYREASFWTTKMMQMEECGTAMSVEISQISYGYDMISDATRHHRTRSCPCADLNTMSCRPTGECMLCFTYF
jgi:hypothetical protein